VINNIVVPTATVVKNDNNNDPVVAAVDPLSASALSVERPASAASLSTTLYIYRIIHTIYTPIHQKFIQ